nr:MAG TPA: hypothetical protein [Caudoviricetes sp.]
MLRRGKTSHKTTSKQHRPDHLTNTHNTTRCRKKLCYTNEYYAQNKHGFNRRIVTGQLCPYTVRVDLGVWWEGSPTLRPGVLLVACIVLYFIWFCLGFKFLFSFLCILCGVFVYH